MNARALKHVKQDDVYTLQPLGGAQEHSSTRLLYDLLNIRLRHGTHRPSTSHKTVTIPEISRTSIKVTQTVL